MRVRYIGPECAILAGTYILEGETRDVTLSQLAAAQRDHPNDFVVLDEPAPDAPISLNEPAPPAVLQDAHGSSTNAGDTPLAATSTGTLTLTPASMRVASTPTRRRH